MMIGYIISGLISTLICACACKLCKKRECRWIRRFIETDTQDSPEGQVEEESSSGAVVEMQEFSLLVLCLLLLTLRLCICILWSYHHCFLKRRNNQELLG